MAERHYLLSESDRAAIAKTVGNDRSGPPRPVTPGKDAPQYETPDSLWALPPCETGLQPNRGEYCCIYRFNKATKQMEPVVDILGRPVRYLVYNNYDYATNALVQIWKHKTGTWHNERPLFLSEDTNRDSTTIQPTNSQQCKGDCFWTVGSDGKWLPVQGGCSNTTTTSTTSTTGTTIAPSTSTTTTAAPCSGKECRLRCVRVTTTAGPGTTSWPPSPYWPLKYQEITPVPLVGCQSPCTCYGAGDPCFLENGEIVSRCILLVTTTSTTTTSTTLVPFTSLCAYTNGIYPPKANWFRAVIRTGGVDGWKVCQKCPTGQVPVYPVGSIPNPNNPTQANFDPMFIHDSPCVQDVCSVADYTNLQEGRAYYYAYVYEDMLRYYGPPDGEVWSSYGENDDQYTARWSICRSCPPGYRPEKPPADILFKQADKNSGLDAGFVVNGVWKYSTKCIKGPECGDCLWVPWGAATATTGTTTSTTTTTKVPCGCEPPPFCGTAGECVKTACVPGGSNVPPSCPTTTNGPNQCYSRQGKLCQCDTSGTTTSTTSTTSSTRPPDCTGCKYLSVRSPYGTCWNGVGTTLIGDGRPPCYEWRLQETHCTNCTGLIANMGCGSYPSTPTSCNSTTWVPCITATTTTPLPCASCYGDCYWRPTYSSETQSFFWQWLPYYASVDSINGKPGSICCPDLDVTGVVDSGESINQQYPCNYIAQDNFGTTARKFCDPNSDTRGTGSNSNNWQLMNAGLPNQMPSTPCRCPAPSRAPTACDWYVTTSCRNTVDDCSCCSGTTVPPCQRSCVYKANGSGGWTSVSNPCVTACPCPTPARASVGTCDRVEYACGSNPTTVPPPTSTTQTSTTSTTTLAPGCCFYDVFGVATCSTGYTDGSCQAAGGAWMGGLPCSSGTCVNVSTTTTGTTTSTTTTSTTTTSTTSTTPVPTGACCVPTAGGGFICLSGQTFAQCSVEGNGLATWYQGQLCSDNPCGTTTTTTTPFPTTSSPTTTPIP